MISETENMELVNSILRDPGIWPNISGGMAEFDTPYLPECLYFLVNECDGVIIFDPFANGLRIHPNILPEKRGKLAYQAVEESIQAVFEMGYVNIYAQIDVELRHIIRFAKDLGFKVLATGPKVLLVRRKMDS